MNPALYLDFFRTFLFRSNSTYVVNSHRRA